MSMSRKRIITGVVGSIVVVASCFYIWCYSALAPAEEQQPYLVKQHQDDTWRVVVRGDSWSMFHNQLNRDSVLQSMLADRLHVPVKVRSRGKGGANSKEIYYYMFSSLTVESEQSPDVCTQPLLEEHPDYCLISAGINDAAQGKGPDFFCQNYQYILRLLLYNHIRPIVLELPTVVMDNKLNFRFEDFLNENRSFAKTRLKIRLGFKLSSLLNGADMDTVDECRDALKKMLELTDLMDSVIYIRTTDWNPDGYRDARGIYLDDGTHLNLAGYAVLDSCLAEAIRKDYLMNAR